MDLPDGRVSSFKAEQRAVESYGRGPEPPNDWTPSCLTSGALVAALCMLGPRNAMALLAYLMEVLHMYIA